MTDKITLKILRNGEFLQFHNNVISIVTDNDPNALLVSALLNPLKTATAEAEALFNKEKGSTFTEALTLLDERRDKAINGIILFVDAHQIHFDAATSNHARALKTNLDAHGTGIAKENYQVETSILKKIVTDWTTKPELVAAVATLGLTAWIAELDTANKAFDAKFLERNKQQGAAPTDKLKEKRVEVGAAYEKLVARINSYFDINAGADPFGKTTRELNVLIDKYNKLLAGRGKNGGDAPLPSNPSK
jgi:hypothetical protein